MLFNRVSTSLVAAFLISSVSPFAYSGSPPFAKERDAAVFFLTPIFSIIDCEAVDVIEDGDVDEHFSTLFFFNDRDQSRVITESEFVGARAKHAQAQSTYVFKMMDLDGNGQVSTHEYRRYISFAIDTADLNKDGELAKIELQGKPTSSYKAKLPVHSSASDTAPTKELTQSTVTKD